MSEGEQEGQCEQQDQYERKRAHTQTKGASASESGYDTNQEASKRTNEGRARMDERARVNNGTGMSKSRCTHKQKGPA
jgi:hypothetical protein